MWIFVGILLALLCGVWGMFFGDLVYHDKGTGLIVGLSFGAIIMVVIIATTIIDF